MPNGAVRAIAANDERRPERAGFALALQGDVYSVVLLSSRHECGLVFDVTASTAQLSSKSFSVTSWGTMATNG